MIKTAFIIFQMLFIVADGYAQIEWEFISSPRGRFGDCNTTSNGSILLSSGFDGKVYKLNAEGELLWLRSVCNCEDEIITTSVETNDNDLVHLTKNGYLYRTDSDGLNSELLLYVTGDTLINDLFGYINDVVVLDQTIFFVGHTDIDNEDYIIRGKIDLAEMTSDYNLEASEDIPRSISYNPNFGFGEFVNTDDGLRIKLFNQSRVETLDTLIEIPVRIRDIVLGDESFYLIGYDGDFLGSNGIVYKLDYDLNTLWQNLYSPEGTDSKVFFNSGVIRNGGLAICGSIGWGFEMSSYFINLTANGDEIHSHRILLTPEGNYGEKIIPVVNEATSFFVSGSTNLIDVGGVDAPFVYKINTSLISSTSGPSNQLNGLIYPNPSSGELTIKVDERFSYDEVRVVNLRGQILQNKEGRQDRLSLDQLPAGIYFVELLNKKLRVGFFEFVLN